MPPPRRDPEGPRDMREINLREYEKSPGVPLSAWERDMLRGVLPSVSIEPAPGMEGTYHLTPGSMVGAFETGGLSVFIEPKIGIAQLLSLACYAIGRIRFRAEDFRFPEKCALPDILARRAAARLQDRGGGAHDRAGAHPPRGAGRTALSECRLWKRCTG